MRRIIWGAVLAAGMLAGAGAEGLPVDEDVVVASEVAESKQINDAEHGQGKQETKTWKFTVTLKNTGVDPLDPLAVKLYVVQMKNWVVVQQEQFREESVLKVFQKEAVPVDGNPVELGDVDISSMNSDAGATKWAGGFKYAGYVLEVYKDGKLADTKLGGGAAVRKAYEAYLKAPGGPAVR